MTKKRQRGFRGLEFVILLLCMLLTVSAFGEAKTKKEPGSGIPSVLQNPSYPVYTTAGMNTYITDTGKNHSHKAHVEVPHAEGTHVEATVHISPDRQRIRVAHLKCPLRISWRGFDFEIQTAVYNYAKDVYEAQGYIKSPFLGGTVYARDIEFNKSGITRVEGLTSPMGGWNVAGFLFTPEKGEITWTGSSIKAKGHLNGKKFFLDMTIEVTGSDLKVSKVHEPGFGLVEHRPSDITGAEIRGNKLYISGQTYIYTGELYHFVNIPVSDDGTVQAGIPVLPGVNPIPGEYQHARKNTGQTLLFMALGGLPGEKIYEIADTAMSIIITDADELENGKQQLTGYIPLPAPLDRANVFEAEADKGETRVDISKNKKMYWEKKKVRVPWTQSDVELKTPVTLKEREEGGSIKGEEGKKYLTSPLFGDIRILEIVAPGDRIWADNYQIDYEVSPIDIPLTDFLGMDNCLGISFGTNKVTIKMDVIQARTWTGFKFSGKIPSLCVGPKDLSWFNSSVYENPSLFFEIHTDQYFKLDVVTGSNCKVPIIPEVLELENPQFHYWRDCFKHTVLTVAGDFVPAIPFGSNIFDIHANFYLDKVGMYPYGGSEVKVYLFKVKVGEGDCAYSGVDKTFTYAGDAEIMGFNLFDNVFRIYLGKSDHVIKGSASRKFTITIHYWWGHWRTKKITITIGVKYHFDRDGSFGIGLGHYDFHVPHGGGTAHYEGPFDCDGITYNGTLDFDNEKGSVEAKGKTGTLNAKTNEDTVSTVLSFDGQSDGANGYYGTITGKGMQLVLHPTVQPGQTVAVSLSPAPQMTKNPDDGIWYMESKDIEVKYTYKDKKGNDVDFDKNCQLRITLNCTTLKVELDLPSDQGGTYSQVFTLPSK